MEKIVKDGLRDCTVILDGSECAVRFDTCFRVFAVRNDSGADVFISKSSGIVPDADGVMCVKSGASAVFAHMDIYADTVYLLGNGRVQVHAQNDSANPFNYAPTIDGGVQASGNPVVMDNLQEGIPFSEMVVSGDNIIGQDLTVNVSGKNLFGDVMNYYLSGTQQDGFNFKPSSANSFCFLGTIINNTNYTIKNYSNGNRFKIVLFKNYPNQAAPDECMEILPTDSNTVTFNSGEYNYCVLSVAYNDENITIKKAQLEIGIAATAYEPYHGSTTIITPTSNPYIIPNDISQQEGYNVISVSEGELSVVGVRKNAAIKRIWDEIDEIKTAIIVSNGESE